PATIPSCLATIRPRSEAPAGTIVFVVTSPVPMSSSSARCMYSEIKLYLATRAGFTQRQAADFTDLRINADQQVAAFLCLVPGEIGCNDPEDVIAFRQLRRIPNTARHLPITHGIRHLVKKPR